MFATQIPGGFADLTLGDSWLQERVRPATAIQEAQQHPRHPQVVITGPTGTGKTSLAAAMAHGKPGVVFALWFDSTWRASDDELRDLKRLVMRCDNLVVDGLGDLPASEEADECVVEFVETVVWSRFGAGLPTIVTTPMTKDQIRFRYGQAATKAIFGGKVIQLDLTYDWRAARQLGIEPLGSDQP